MTSYLLPGLLTLVVGQATEATNWALAAAVIGALAAAVVVWALMTQKSLGAKVTSLAGQLSQLQQEHKQLRESDRKQGKNLDSKRDEIEKLRKDLASQRKKTHQLQEQEKQLREQVREQKEAYLKAKESRPAFAEPATTGASKSAPEPRKSESAPQHAEDTHAPQTAGASSTASLQQLAEDAKKLEERNKRLAEDLAGEKKQADSARRELNKLARRLEDYRRADVIGKSKVELLEDKVRHLGRQYYEAVSEVAALKGEVPTLARPAEMPDEQRARPSETAPTAETAETNSEASANA